MRVERVLRKQHGDPEKQLQRARESDKIHPTGCSYQLRYVRFLGDLTSVLQGCVRVAPE